MEQQLVARIKRRSKYWGQTEPNQWFDVRVVEDAGYRLRGNNNNYRLDDVVFGVRLADGLIVDLANGKTSRGECRIGAVETMRAPLRSLSVLIPLIDRIADHPSDPIACQAAVARSAGQGRPHRGRRSLALDRSEHDGRLMAHRNGGAYAAVPTLMAILIACAMIAVMTSPVSADPSARNAPAPSGSTVASTDPWAAHITEAAKRFAIPELWIRAVMTVESAGDTAALSRKGAIGLMQVMPDTWDELRVKHGLGNDPRQPRDNILAGGAYLRAMHDRYGAIAAMLAAYNAGPGRYDEHLASGRALPDETVDYVAKIMSMIDGTPAFASSIDRPLRPTWSRAPLFVARSGVTDDDALKTDDRPSGRPSDVAPIADVTALVPLSDGLFVHRPEAGGQRR